MLTAAQQDYIEVIYRIEQSGARVRVTDIAAELGTKLPTVTRTIQKLTAMGLVRHATRGEVRLSAAGRRIATEVVHRHDDLVQFFVSYLGLSRKLAESDTCQIEHGLSATTTQRFHEFLEFIAQLPDNHRQALRSFLPRASGGRKDFRNLPEHKTTGWRR
jgi:DtxR family transcriptional regulator, Mn-dependent transcriptional regulator